MEGSNDDDNDENKHLLSLFQGPGILLNTFLKLCVFPISTNLSPHFKDEKKKFCGF